MICKTPNCTHGFVPPATSQSTFLPIIRTTSLCSSVKWDGKLCCPGTEMSFDVPFFSVSLGSVGFPRVECPTPSSPTKGRTQVGLRGKGGGDSGLLLPGRTLMLLARAGTPGPQSGQRGPGSQFWLHLTASWRSVRRASGNSCAHFQDTKYGPVSREEVNLCN